MDVDQERIGAVRSLGALPLFQLSTAGMELFHTNLLFWLAKQHPAASASLWRTLGVEPPHASGAVRREWRHFDLFLEYAGGTQALLLENKIGAIPTGDQLARYWEDVAGAQCRRPKITQSGGRPQGMGENERQECTCSVVGLWAHWVGPRRGNGRDPPGLVRLERDRDQSTRPRDRQPESALHEHHLLPGACRSRCRIRRVQPSGSPLPFLDQG